MRSSSHHCVVAASSSSRRSRVSLVRTVRGAVRAPGSGLAAKGRCSPCSDWQGTWRSSGLGPAATAARAPARPRRVVVASLPHLGLAWPGARCGAAAGLEMEAVHREFKPPPIPRKLKQRDGGRGGRGFREGRGTGGAL